MNAQTPRPNNRRAARRPAIETASPSSDQPESTIAMRLRRRGGIPDDVAAYIRHEILTGSLRPGQKIDQEAIGETLDVSRSPIREAIVILGQEGLLDVTPRRGAAVADLTPQDVSDHYELVGLVAGRAAGIAATELADAEIAELTAINDEFQRGHDLSPTELSELNDSFHRLINSAAPRRTRWLLGLLARSVPTDFFEFTDGWDEKAVGHHDEILAAITARDAGRARDSMEHHLRESGLAAAESLRARGYWADDTDKKGIA